MKTASLPKGAIHLVDVVGGVEVHTIKCPPPGLDASGWEAFKTCTFRGHRRAVEEQRCR